MSLELRVGPFLFLRLRLVSVLQLEGYNGHTRCGLNNLELSVNLRRSRCDFGTSSCRSDRD